MPIRLPIKAPKKESSNVMFIVYYKGVNMSSKCPYRQACGEGKISQLRRCIYTCKTCKHMAYDALCTCEQEQDCNNFCLQRPNGKNYWEPKE